MESKKKLSLIFEIIIMYYTMKKNGINLHSFLLKDLKAQNVTIENSKSKRKHRESGRTSEC